MQLKSSDLMKGLVWQLICKDVCCGSKRPGRIEQRSFTEYLHGANTKKVPCSLIPDFSIATVTSVLATSN